jgi:hypothetical protein
MWDMTKGHIIRLGLAFAVTAIPSVSMAQSGWIPPTEILGQPIQATTNGVTNTLYFDPGGTLRILTPAGNTLQGTWQINGSQLCMNLEGQQECVPYDRPFAAGEPRDLRSSCNAATVWVAQAVNVAPPVSPAERGR